MWRYSLRIFVSLLFLILLLWIVIQNEKFQNWAIGKTTAYLSKELQTEVAISKINIDLFDKLILEGMYIEDHSGDTLLYSEHLKTTLSTNLIGLLKGSVDIDDIQLENATFHINRDSGQYTKIIYRYF